MDYDKLQSQNQVSGIPPEFFEAEMIDSLWSTFEGHSKIYEDRSHSKSTQAHTKYIEDHPKVKREHPRAFGKIPKIVRE